MLLFIINSTHLQYTPQAPVCNEITTDGVCKREGIEILGYSKQAKNNTVKIYDFDSNEVLLSCKKNTCTGDISSLNTVVKRALEMASMEDNAFRVGAETVSLQGNIVTIVYKTRHDKNIIEYVFHDFE